MTLVNGLRNIKKQVRTERRSPSMLKERKEHWVTGRGWWLDGRGMKERRQERDDFK